jgi:hypothetical protein
LAQVRALHGVGSCSLKKATCRLMGIQDDRRCCSALSDLLTNM